MLEADDKAAELVKALTYQGFQYASSIIPEVADTVNPIDDAVRWGFMHEAGPFETWDMLGVKETVKQMKAAGYPAAKWVSEMLKSGVESFYQYKNGEKVAVYDAVKGKYTKLKKPEGVIVLKQQKIVAQNAGATLRDMGDGVACLEFHTKMNSLDEDIMNMTIETFEHLENFDGLVIGNEAENFSAGANLVYDGGWCATRHVGYARWRGTQVAGYEHAHALFAEADCRCACGSYAWRRM